MAHLTARARAWWLQLRAMAAELTFDGRLRSLNRRESRALVLLGESAEAAGIGWSDESRSLLARLRELRTRLQQMDSALAASREADRADFAAAPGWLQPLVLARGIADRAVLRHQTASLRRDLPEPLEGLGRAALVHPGGAARLPGRLVSAVEEVRSELAGVQEARGRRLAGFGGSALPTWSRHLPGESRALGYALWLHLRPNVLPRFPALAGLLVGWWIAATYTDSHLRSALHSLGIGQGGRRVVSGDTYRAMLFWLPILTAGICAYLADKAKLVIGRRYLQSAASMPRTSEK